MAESHVSRNTEPATTPPRRGFITSMLTLIVGSFVGLFSLISGVIVYLDPLRNKRRLPAVAGDSGAAGASEFIKVCSAQAVGEQPRRFPIVTDKMDAWNYLPDQAVGSVYLSKKDDGSLLVLHTTCPHAGCSVALSPDGDAFHCPCHNSSFNLKGERESRPGKENPSPRDMDTLQYDQERYRQDGEVWVNYVDYYTGKEEQVPKI